MGPIAAETDCDLDGEANRCVGYDGRGLLVLLMSGRTDWRMPNINELKSVTDIRVSSPAIDTAYFPATVANSSYWSSTATGANFVSWLVNQSGGSAGTNSIWTSWQVRCVAGP